MNEENKDYYVLVNVFELDRLLMDKKGKSFFEYKADNITCPHIEVCKGGEKIDITNCIDESLSVYTYDKNGEINKCCEDIILIIKENNKKELVLPSNNKIEYIIKYEKHLCNTDTIRLNSCFPKVVIIKYDDFVKR